MSLLSCTPEDKIIAIKNAWHYIEDVYGVGALILEMQGGVCIRLCNDNPQQYLHINHSLTGSCQEYTHIESWLLEVLTEDVEFIVSLRMGAGCEEGTKPSLKRCIDVEESSIKKRKLYR
jgi:hypothetical protein